MHTPVESKSQERVLTTTSCGVLSVLAIRDHSSYELTKQMRLSLHYIWPRAESNVYAEPKRLVAAGLAEAREEWKGGRRRTIYSITEAGRAALAAWLASPSSHQRYESEALLKVFFAENGTLEDMLAAIRALRDEAATLIDHWQQIADRYEKGEGQNPDRFALSALVARLLGEQQMATVRWAEWAEALVSRWGTPPGEDVTWGIETIRATGEAFPADTEPAPAGDHASRTVASRGMVAEHPRSSSSDVPAHSRRRAADIYDGRHPGS